MKKLRYLQLIPPTVGNQATPRPAHHAERRLGKGQTRQILALGTPSPNEQRAGSILNTGAFSEDLYPKQ